MRGPSSRRAWLVAFGIVLLALIIYGLSRPPSVGTLAAQPPPTWGHVTLARIAKAQALAAGDGHPTSAVWLQAPRFKAMPVLNGTQSQSADVEFVVSMDGAFRAPSGWSLLPGSKTAGSALTILVRGFDGTVTGRIITARPPAIGELGRTYSLRLGLF